MGGQFQLTDDGLYLFVHLPATAGINLGLQVFHCLHSLFVRTLLGLVVKPVDERLLVGQTFPHNIRNIAFQVPRQGLFQLADAEVATEVDFAVVGLDLSGENFQQSGFSRTIAADQTNPFTGFHRKLGIDQQWHIAKFNGNIVDPDQSHETAGLWFGRGILTEFR